MNSIIITFLTQHICAYFARILKWICYTQIVFQIITCYVHAEPVYSNFSFERPLHHSSIQGVHWMCFHPISNTALMVWFHARLISNTALMTWIHSIISSQKLPSWFKIFLHQIDQYLGLVETQILTSIGDMLCAVFSNTQPIYSK